MKKYFMLLVFYVVTYTANGQDHCLSFDGSNDYLMGNNLINNEQGTWETWIQKANWADHHDDILFSNGRLYDTTDCFYISLHPAVGLHFRYGGLYQAGNKFISTIATQSFAANSWHHIAATWFRDTTNGITSLALFIDGGLVASDTTLGYFDVANTNHCYMGGDIVNAPFGLGSMDDIRIWNEAHPANTIHYYSSKNINYPDPSLVALINFNNGIGSGDNSSLTQIPNLANPSNPFQFMNFSLNGSTSNLINTTRTTISYVEGVDGNNPTIQVHGTHLEGVTSMYIGNTLINSFLSNDSTTIRVDGTGSPNGGVSLQTPLGGYATSSYAFNLVSQEVMQFDGVNDYLKKDSVNFNSDEGTWMVWVNKDNWLDQHMDYLFGNGLDETQADAFYISLHSVVGIHVRYGGVYQNGNVYIADYSSFSFANQRWQQIAVTWKRQGNSTTLKLYQNGMFIDSAVASFVINLSGPFYIGGAPGLSSFGSGKMDDMQVWSVAKTPIEIMAHFQQSNLQNTPYPQPSLLSLINFNSGYTTWNNTQFLVSGLPDLIAPYESFTFHNFALTGSQSNFTYAFNPL
ncbi:MAG TPA: LamG domain-containing protein, partial [Chitinophagaceae bacterium]|nr:LamG domain-containing protein [Chitinophagaceae bacterium]